MYSIGWFSTAKGPGSRNLLKAIVNAISCGEIEAQISFVFVSREPGESSETDKFFALAESYGLPIRYLSSRRFRQQWEETGVAGGNNDWRTAYDASVKQLLAGFHKPDISILAGYMLIVSPEMCTEYDMINLHPAAPDGPTGTWQEVIWQLIAQKAYTSGVMTHLVTPELDKGPVISYCRFPIRGNGHFDRYWQEMPPGGVNEIRANEGESNQLFREIRRHGMVRELPLIVSTIKAFSRGTIKVHRGQLYDQSSQLTGGYDMSEEIDKLVQSELDEQI